MTTVTTRNEQETLALAEKLGKTLRGGEVVCLSGRLGAGKTAFTKGIAASFGIKTTVTSPTFTIMKEYDGRLKLRHFDMYRIEDASELEELGFEEVLFEEDGVCVIEWNKLRFDRPTIDVTIEYTDENERKITIVGGDDEALGA